MAAEFADKKKPDKENGYHFGKLRDRRGSYWDRMEILLEQMGILRGRD